MPVPYAQPGSGWAQANTSLAALGSGATPSQKAAATYVGTSIARNPAPVALSGTAAEIAFENVTVTAGQKIIVNAVLSAAIGTPAAASSITLDIRVNGASALSEEVVQSFPSDAVGAVVSFFTVLALAAGTYRLSVYGRLESEAAAATIDAAQGAIMAQVVNA